MALESASSGSSSASLVPALMHASRPTIGVSMPPFEPMSSSLSMQSTKILLLVASLLALFTLAWLIEYGILLSVLYRIVYRLINLIHFLISGIIGFIKKQC